MKARSRFAPQSSFDVARTLFTHAILTLWCCRRAIQLEVDLSGFPNVLAHFKRMQERQSVKKLLAYEKEVNEGFAKTA